MISTILIFLLVLSLLVFVHELGHFLVAKKSGMKVEEFGFGFPPRAFGMKRGETTYSLNWIPLGGFVKIKGESGDYRFDPDSFASKPIWKRFAVLIAGVAMNMVLAVMLLSIGFMIGMPSVIDGNTSDSARISAEEITIMSVLEGSPAAEAGVITGDAIASIDGRVFKSDEAVRTYLADNASSGVELMVQHRDESYDTFHVTSSFLEEANVVGIGIGLAHTGMVALPAHLAFVQGVSATAQFTEEIFGAFYGLVKDLVVAQEVNVELSGPVGIAVITGEVAQLGIVPLLQFAAVLSINLAILNIMPFPALDGGRILFLLIEAVRRKPVDERIEALVHNAGFAALMLLVLLVTYRDIVTFGDQIMGGIKGLFS